MKYRVGIDLGTNSLGWAAIQLKGDTPDSLKPGPLVDMGVRIFSDARNPKDKSSNAAQRRAPRSARRNRDRKASRARAMLHALEKIGLMPSDHSKRVQLEKLDPWILRARALDDPLEPFEIGRAIFHLQERRGFKSNRKTDGDAESAMFDAIEAAQERMRESGARTLGELFGKPRLVQLRANLAAAEGDRAPLPQARVKTQSIGTKLAYDYYPSRAMILDEFDRIWNRQAAYHPDIMTREAYDEIRFVVEYQRPLKTQSAGRCTFLPEEPRAPKALPSSQYARILQEVNNLRVGAIGDEARSLNEVERKRVVEFLACPSSKSAKRTFKAIRKLLSLPESQRFNLESAKRDYLLGDTTAAVLMQENAWGRAWFEFELAQRDEIVQQLIEVEEEDDIVAWLRSHRWLPDDRALAVSRVRLPDSHGRLSKAALDRIIPRLEAGERFDEATKAEFGDHRAFECGEVHEKKLPYYGKVLSRHTAFAKDGSEDEEEKFGRVANPTVHVALNQLKEVINDLIRRWGTPEQIVLELARDLPLSDRGLREIEARQKKNQDANDVRRRDIEQCGVIDSYRNRLKLRLYEEALEAFAGSVVCVFSGKTISKTELFSEAVEIEHILPLSRTLDDSFANKVLSTREANRIKKNQTPWEAFGSKTCEGYDWEKIGQRAAQLPASKAWRFDPNSMKRWEARGGDFLARQLNDTRYIARLGKSYIEALFGGQGFEGQRRHVWVVPGQLTADLRHFAGFNNLTGISGGNRKDRTDHRHHAIDALVVALTDQAMVQRAADLAKSEDAVEHNEIMQVMAAPLKRYRASAEDRLSKLIISHKPDHGYQDAMHNDTAYGVTGRRDSKGQMLLVTRKPLESIGPTDIGAIVDDRLRAVFRAETEGLSGKQFSETLLEVGGSMCPPVRRVRVVTPMKESSFITIRHGEARQHVKAYKTDGNYCYDLFADGKGRWTGEVITTYQAYQNAQLDPEWWRKPVGRDQQPIIMRLRKGDMLEIDGPTGGRICVVVYKFSKGRVSMADHHEANASARIRAKELDGYQMSPSSLQKANAIRITVSPSGKIKRHKV